MKDGRLPVRADHGYGSQAEVRRSAATLAAQEW
jgi:hypothetical protein